jgi:hypothetical protein
MEDDMTTEQHLREARRYDMLAREADLSVASAMPGSYYRSMAEKHRSEARRQDAAP